MRKTWLIKTPISTLSQDLKQEKLTEFTGKQNFFYFDHDFFGVLCL